MTRIAIIVLVLTACSHAAAPGVVVEDAAVSQTGQDAQAQCGKPSGTNSVCRSVTWPRIVIAFGDAASAGFVYTFRSDDGIVSSDRNPCPDPSVYGQSPALHCDISFYGNPSEKVVAVAIRQPDGGASLLEREIPLTTFNYCGDGIDQLIATVDTNGVPQLSEVTHVNACSL